MPPGIKPIPPYCFSCKVKGLHSYTITPSNFSLPRYAELMADLILPGGKILAECFEYDPTVYGGMNVTFYFQYIDFKNYLVTLLPCYPVTLLPCRPVILSPCYLVTLLPFYLVTLLPCHLVTLLSCYLVTLLPCYPVTLSPCYLFTLSPCHLGTLLPCNHCHNLLQNECM